MITKLHNNQKIQIKGTRPYPQDCTIGTLKGFYDKNTFLGELTQEKIDNELSKDGGREFWINLNAVTLTDDRAYNLEQSAIREASPHLAVGDKVEIDGRFFVIGNANNNNFELLEIK